MRRRWSPFVCLYCGRPEPDATPSRAHIFSDALGGVTHTSDTVCVECNGLTNRRFESEAAKRLACYRSVWGIEGRRGIPRVRARVSIGNWSAPVRLDETGEPGLAVGVVNDPARGKMFHVAGPEAEVAKRIAEIEKGVPGVKWREQESDVHVVIPVESDPGVLDLRRLAAKIALERLADLRGPEFVRVGDFDRARSLVLIGDEAAPIVVPVYDPAWMDAPGALSFRLPCHAVALFGMRDDSTLGAFVALFGVYHYWILLSRTYHPLADWDDLLQENPQTREVWCPTLRSAIGAIRLPWRRWVAAWAQSPREVVRLVMGNVQRKFDAAADRHYGSGVEQAR
jgi:hypothetical protein